MKFKKVRGIVYVAGYPGMTRDEYEVRRNLRIHIGEENWPPYDQIPDESLEANLDDASSPSP